jgi:NADH dehydrogenase [ubiquinone] 1 alpha subcomplex assembly factor 3
VVDLAPWDSNTIPLMKWPHEKFEDITVFDTKSSRLVGMNHDTFEKFKKMMADRKAGKEPEEEVEFDQERIVADQKGKLYDLSKNRFVPQNDARYHPYRRGNWRLHPSV